MSSVNNLKIQIQDIDRKIERLNLQKQMLLDRINRKEQHSKRIFEQKANDLRAKNVNLRTNGQETELSNRFQ